MDIAVIYMTVSLAMLNAGAFIYAAWRLNKNERDWGAMGIAAFCMLTVGVCAIAVKLQ
jgi:hypothetical protein